MKRRLFNLLATVSLVLCVVIVMLWARSEIVGDRLTWNWQVDPSCARTIMLASGGPRGSLLLYCESLSVQVAPPLLGTFTSEASKSLWTSFDTSDDALPSAYPGDSYHGFRIGRVEDHPYIFARGLNQSEWWIGLPAWFVTGVFAILPCCWLFGLRRRGRLIGSGRCLACGYDLRASKERCPECGAAIPAEAARGRC